MIMGDYFKNQGWDGKTDLNWFSCNTGSGTLAQDFANTYGVSVYAPNGYYAVPIIGDGYVTQGGFVPFSFFESGKMIRFGQ